MEFIIKLFIFFMYIELIYCRSVNICPFLVCDPDNLTRVTQYPQ